MYLYNYNTGAVRWSDELDIKNVTPLLATRVLVGVIDVEKKRALILDQENNLGWADIPEMENPTDEEIAKLV